MDAGDLSKVRASAAAFRRAIIQAKPYVILLSLYEFPRRSCGDASLLLSRFLADNGVHGTIYAWGFQGNYTHAWLELGDSVIDITADQFAGDPEAELWLRRPPEAHDGVIVTSNIAWYSRFEDARRHSPRIDEYDEVTNKLLKDAYRQILSQLRDHAGANSACRPRTTLTN